MFLHLSNDHNKKIFGSTDCFAMSVNTIDMNFDESFESGFMKDYIDSLLWVTFKNDKQGLIHALAAYDAKSGDEIKNYLNSNPILRFCNWSNQ